MRYNFPLKVKGERVWRVYVGGRELDKIEKKENPRDGDMPELWMLSTVRAANPGREDIEEGICYLEDTDERISLRELIEKYPAQMLGEDHLAKYGSDMGVLIKLLDPCERLVMQVHPDKEDARTLFSSQFGKTEIWHILGVREDWPEPPCVYLGFKEGVTRKDWVDAFNRDDSQKMLDMLHKITVSPGESYIVYGGVPHAAGAGILYLEIQEATDLTIRVERRMASGLAIADKAIHQGLGFERMFDCFRYDGKSQDQVKRDWLLERKCIENTDDYTVETIVDYTATPCFGTEKVKVTGSMTITPGGKFSGLYVLSGRGQLEHPSHKASLAPNDQIFIPACCAPFKITSTGDAPLVFFNIYGPQSPAP